MLGYVTGGERGAADVLLGDVAAALRVQGVSLAGVIQVNETYDPARPCHMDLHVLSGAEVVRISQNLGALSKGCRLDPSGLEQAVGLVERALEAGPGFLPALLIINKYGKQEVVGRGFRPLIGQALAAGVPVLTSVNTANQAAFDQFAEGMAMPLACSFEAVMEFCREHVLGGKVL
jgi:hypothetical protein